MQIRKTEFECDNCKETAVPDEKVTKRNPLPKEWVDLTCRSNEGYHFELELCPKCSAAVLKALAKRRKD